MDPMIKNGEPVDQMKNAYNNSQMLDRLFLQGEQRRLGSSKKQSVKGQSLAASTANIPMSNQPNTADFMPTSATSATAFYAASK